MADVMTGVGFNGWRGGLSLEAASDAQPSRAWSQQHWGQQSLESAVLGAGIVSGPDDRRNVELCLSSRFESTEADLIAGVRVRRRAEHWAALESALIGDEANGNMDIYGTIENETQRSEEDSLKAHPM